MRNLTITRAKSFVACLGKMKVYIEDPDTNELMINGVPCRKLGTIKNGETVTFPIGDLAAKVFVIADKASRNYSNDYYPLPAGAEDITISGKNQYNLSAGHPFRFDGVTDPEVLANRKQGSRKGTWILVAALILGFVLGLVRNLPAMNSDDPKDFSVAGMTITLTKAFDEESYQGFTQCYESSSVAVFAMKEEFTLMAGLEDYTLEDYGLLVVQSNGMDESALKTENGVYYFEYTAEGGDGDSYYYMATIHKSGDAFWLIQFATPASNQETLHDQLLT